MGVAYASLKTAAKTELDRYIDEAHDYISKRWAHEPWALREWTVSLASGTATFPLAVDVRHIELITESDGTNKRTTKIVTKADYHRAFDGGTAHPWDQQDDPRYFFDGMDDSNPPKQQWKRAPKPTAALTLTVVGRPYFGMIGTDTYTELPPSTVTELRHHLRMLWAAFRKDDEDMRREQALREDAIRASQVNDNPTGAAEVAIRPDMPAEAYNEMTW